MEMDGKGKAVPRMPVVDWSPADGDFVHHCPTYAIHAEPVGAHDENLQEAMEPKTAKEKQERQEIA